MGIKETISLITTCIFYFLIILGLILLFLPEFKKFWLAFKIRKRLPVNQINKKRNKIKWQIELALLTVFNRKISIHIAAAVTIILFFAVYIAGLRFFMLPKALFLAFLMAALPCLFVYILASSAWKAGSYEGEALLSEFLRQYKLNSMNVDKTLEEMIKGKTEIKNTRQSVYSLLIMLRSSADKEDVNEATEEFAKKIKTNWARMFAHNIYIAFTDGTDISLAIEDILIQLREARALSEERKRINSESIRMAWFLAPAIYFATVLMATNYLGMTFGKFLHNQLGTPEGFFYFSLIVFLFLLNICLLTFVVNQRFDY